MPTPAAVQKFLNHLRYNTEPPPHRAMLRTFRGVVRHRTAHCLEAALTAVRNAAAITASGGKQDAASDLDAETPGGGGPEGSRSGEEVG